jgi:hypothetical protein
VVCCRRLESLKRRLEKLCGEHSKDFSKRPEHYWREILDKQIDFEASLTDQYICGCGKYRPDRVYITKDIVYMLELDEDSHKDNIEDCEIARLINLKDGFPDHKVLVIRMNPNQCTSVPKELKEFQDRTIFQIEIMRRYMDTEILSPLITNVIYITYGSGGAKHINKVKEHPDKVNLLGCYYCDL